MRRLLLVTNAIAIIAICGVITLHILTDRAQSLRDATADLLNLRAAVTEQTRQTLTAVKLALGGIAENAHADDLGREQTFTALRTRQEIFSPVFAFYILDAQGRLAASSRTSNPEPIDFSGEPTFTKHRDDPNLDLFIAPLRKGKVGYAKDKWVVTISRRLDHPDGRFGGVIAAALSVDYMTEVYDASRMGDHGVVGIAATDGTVIARTPFKEDFLGQVLSDTRMVRELSHSADAGVYRVRSETDGIDRVVGYSRVPGFPLVVFTGISPAEFLARWGWHAFVESVLGLLTIVVMVAFSTFLARRMRERQDEQDARARQLTKLTELSMVLLASNDVAAALQRTAEMARELVPCHQAVSSLTNRYSMAQIIHAVSLSDKYAAWRGYEEKPDGSGIYREVCEANRPMRLTQAELEAHPAWRGFGAAKESHPPIRGWLAVPLTTEDGQNLGLIQLSDRERGDFTAEDEALIVELAHVTSVAIHKLKLNDELRNVAAEADRLRADAEAARASEERARSEIEAILRSIRDAVFAVDSDWRFTFLNRQAEEVLERNAAGLIGRNVWDEFPEAIGSEAFVQYHRAREENVDVDFRFYYPPLKRWFDVRAFPQDEGGLTVYFQDVSHLVVQEEQLRQAQRMEAVGQLTGGVAHDFNNLLTVILGNAEVVLSEWDGNTDHYHLISMVCNAAEKAADLTQRLLAFSRRQPLDPKAVNVNDLIEELRPLLRRTIGEHYDIEFVCQNGIEKAIVDPGQLQNAIVNLAVNARDAMPDGGRLTIETCGVEIDEDYVETHVYAAPGRYVMIAVGDNGVGMSAEVRSHAFEPFFTTKDVGEGTGLGLSMVYGFVKQSNGHVNIYSEIGEGTTVKLYLPCAQIDAVAENGEDAPDAVQRGTERILVVEDDEMVREYTTKALNSLGYAVVAVADGPAACALLGADERFDLLLCDVILGGGMNGRQVVEAARVLRPDLKVLHMSGYTESVIAHHGRLDAEVRLLLKPFRRADLAAKVREALNGMN